MPPLLKRDVKLGEGVNLQRWAVVKRIGDGGFAEVYEVTDTFKDDEKFAVKIDKQDKRKDVRSGTVKAEVKVLRQLQSCPPVCRLVPEGEGTHEGRSYMIMELLGVNLAQFQHSRPQGRIQPDALKSIALETLAALEGVHQAGYIHRDVKPANFAQTQGSAASTTGGDWRIIDFGIARRFVDDAGRPLPKREDFGEFRGSTTYASIHAHLKQDLGRRDDLWSWLYIVVEMHEGNLPWRAASGDASAGSEHSPKETAMRMKQQALDDPHVLSATGKLPEALVAISSYLRSTCFVDEPDYELLRECIASLPSTPAPAPRQPALPNGHATPPPAQPQYAPGPMWPHAAPTSAPPPMYANGGAHPTVPVSHGSFAQLPPASYAHMHAHGYYGWSYGAQGQHSGHPQHMPVSYMQGYTGNSTLQQQPHVPITLSAPPGPRQQPPSQANGSTAQVPASTGAPASGGPSAASSQTAAEFDADGQLGQIGSAFDDDEDFGQAARPHSNGRAAKRPLTADQEPPDDLPASKRVRFSPTVGGLAQARDPLKDRWVRRMRGVPVGAVAEMEKRAGVVYRGQLSEKGKETKELFRTLDPGEGLGIMAWMVDSLSRNTDKKGASQVAQWLGSLAAFSDECAIRCQARRKFRQT
ncbi:hypothetical protein WJX75_003368 [Coccomyxa subellipsoidea]|uniref:Protein kinase domain-containing protein n=1 Tax=Coccomyxa subellipsoidea TaxID=248742 RepID=A0ABR2YJ64_9CHLO